ncbi:hypothetical protein ACFQYP_41575 [Nonomuraea antimicrobica]
MVRSRDLLSALGFGPDEEALYELLVDHSPATLDQLFAAWPRADLVPLLAALEARGLLSSSPGPPARYAAVAPEVALDVLLLAAERDLLLVRERARELEEVFQERARKRTPRSSSRSSPGGGRSSSGTPRSSGRPGNSSAACPSRPISTRSAA